MILFFGFKMKFRVSFLKKSCEIFAEIRLSVLMFFFEIFGFFHENICELNRFNPKNKKNNKKKLFIKLCDILQTSQQI